MICAMIISEDNLDECRRIMNIDQIPTHFVERQTWLIYRTNINGEVCTGWTVPHAIFRNRYNVIETRSTCFVVERITNKNRCPQDSESMHFYQENGVCMYCGGQDN